MKCRVCEKEMNEQKKQKMIMKSYHVCNGINCLEHRIEFKNNRYLEAWLKVYPSTVKKVGFKFNPIKVEATVVFFKLSKIE